MPPDGPEGDLDRDEGTDVRDLREWGFKSGEKACLIKKATGMIGFMPVAFLGTSRDTADRSGGLGAHCV